MASFIWKISRGECSRPHTISLASLQKNTNESPQPEPTLPYFFVTSLSTFSQAADASYTYLKPIQARSPSSIAFAARSNTHASAGVRPAEISASAAGVTCARPSSASAVKHGKSSKESSTGLPAATSAASERRNSAVTIRTTNLSLKRRHLPRIAFHPQAGHDARRRTKQVPAKCS